MRKVVVTGMGIVSPLGIGLEANWKAIQEGKSGISPIFLFEDSSGLATQFAGQVADFDATQWMTPPEVRRYDRFLHLAVAAGLEAVEHSGLVIDDRNAKRVGCIVGVGLGGMPSLETRHTTEPNTHNTADSLRIAIVDDEPTVLHSLQSRRNGEMKKAIVATHLRRRHPLGGIKVSHLACKLCRQTRGVFKEEDRRYAALTFLNGLPVGLKTNAEG